MVASWRLYQAKALRKRLAKANMEETNLSWPENQKPTKRLNVCAKTKEKTENENNKKPKPKWKREYVHSIN